MCFSLLRLEYGREEGSDAWGLYRIFKLHTLPVHICKVNFFKGNLTKTTFRSKRRNNMRSSRSYVIAIQRRNRPGLAIQACFTDVSFLPRTAIKMTNIYLSQAFITYYYQDQEKEKERERAFPRTAEGHMLRTFQWDEIKNSAFQWMRLYIQVRKPDQHTFDELICDSFSSEMSRKCNNGLPDLDLNSRAEQQLHLQFQLLVGTELNSVRGDRKRRPNSKE
ncbi:hypothetical protein M0802_013301 [Mischocyttarus mexicanus]|nr:hypothetical protein M0802_015255 [Mischocyttarus mexicanus]KAI4483441.1 hypothetical protein M0802_013392 [Mischocyttarus mexicanus]KAI4483818.1 hypothetical protein M0802_013301 [Mischocyttarus mexicanus]